MNLSDVEIKITEAFQPGLYVKQLLGNNGDCLAYILVGDFVLYVDLKGETTIISDNNFITNKSHMTLKTYNQVLEEPESYNFISEQELEWTLTHDGKELLTRTISIPKLTTELEFKCRLMRQLSSFMLTAFNDLTTAEEHTFFNELNEYQFVTVEHNSLDSDSIKKSIYQLLSQSPELLNTLSNIEVESSVFQTKNIVKSFTTMIYRADNQFVVESVRELVEDAEYID